MAESIIKGRRKGFTMIYNSVLKDNRLDLKTKGFFAVMMSFPEEWEFSIKGLCSVMGIGRDAVKGCLKQLEDAGYLLKEQIRGEHGKFAYNCYVLLEESGSAPMVDTPGFSPSTEKPSPVEPSTAEPSPVNPHQSNTIENKDYTYIPPIVPQEGTAQKPKKKKRGVKTAPDHEPERFEKFWAAYPRHESKQKAISAWDKLKADAQLLHRMSVALAAQLKSAAWKQGIGIPYASTWINERRWEDVPYEPPQKGDAGGWAPDAEVID